MRLTTRLAALAAVLTLALAAPASADLIFDNSATGNRGITGAGSLQIGDEVTAAAGTSRVVTELDLGFTSQGAPATANVQAFLYANDGTNGAPGTLLWASAIMTGVNFNTTNALVAFAVPSITVPDTFTFAGVITNGTGFLGFVPATGASVGTFDTVYAGSPGSFSTLASVFEIEGRVITSAAVPEPSSLALCGIAGVVGLGYARSRARRIAR